MFIRKIIGLKKVCQSDRHTAANNDVCYNLFQMPRVKIEICNGVEYNINHVHTQYKIMPQACLYER